MKRSHRGARIVVRSADPALRSLIVERLSSMGDLEVEERDGDSAHDVADGGPDALVEIRDDGRRQLTPRETEVLALLAEGLANKEIAFRLGISFSTAKFHVDSIFHKLSASNRAEAVALGMRGGEIML